MIQDKFIMSEFSVHLHEVFAELGTITIRRMFGGYGVYHQGLMFALVADDALYLKADAQNLAHFSKRGLPPFQYSKQGKLLNIAYYLAPDEILDDPAAAAEWGRRSHAAALRASQAVKKRRRAARAS
jgi:DNA transformation protein and related proteins